ncbi:MAG: TfoX/Sxy family protein [Parvularculaceae bacterium]
MSISATFIEQAKELFAPFGDIRVRKMFGGAGLYCGDLFFAILDDGAIYFKADDGTRKTFEARGLSPFTFEMKDGSAATMSYYAAPDDIFDDEEDLRRWTTLALDAARRAARFKKKKPAKKAARR